MSGDELHPGEPLAAAVGALREAPGVPAGLLDRARHRARRQRRRRGAAATAIAAVLVVTALFARPERHPAGQVTFALSAPASNGVSLVGDFNDWERDRVRLERVGNEWRVTLKLPPGRYRYSYVTDEGEWLADPDAPPALDEFGTPTSVITISSES